MTANSAEITTFAPGDDRGIGLAMFVIFTAAILIVTGAVAMLALISTWWLLGIAFGIHVLMTTIVGLVVFGALGGGSLMLGDRARRSAIDDGQEPELPVRGRMDQGPAYPAAA
jgi:hypothetical protein